MEVGVYAVLLLSSSCLPIVYPVRAFASTSTNRHSFIGIGSAMYPNIFQYPAIFAFQLCVVRLASAGV